MIHVLNRSFSLVYYPTDKKVSGKSKDEQMAEKKQELEKRLQDVTGQLGTNKKTTKKGMCCYCNTHMYFKNYIKL